MRFSRVGCVQITLMNCLYSYTQLYYPVRVPLPIKDSSIEPLVLMLF